MDVLFERCAGLDVHKAFLIVCLLLGGGPKPKKLIQRFDTTTPGLLDLRDWLLQHGCTIIAMESTGVYWKPVYAVLEEDLSIVVGNARHMRNVPGRKTDVKDAEWIGQLLRHGLIRSSFVPPKDLRQLRDLLRYRTKLTHGRTAERNRVLKLLEDANIKLGSVASDAFGASGMAMLQALIEGQEPPANIAELARGRLRKKIPELTRALTGRLEDHHRDILRLQLRRLADIERDIAELDTKIDKRLEPYREEHRRLMRIPGVDWIIAAIIIAELGVTMSVYPTAKHAAAWSGVAPANCQSAGKSLGNFTRRGNPYLRVALVQAANTLHASKGTYLGDKFRRLKARRGYKRAAMAIAHKILVSAYNIIKLKAEYRELGNTYLDTIDKDRTVDRMVRRLTRLGYKTHLEPIPGPNTPQPAAA